ncbi:MAG: RtcB family protein, partial [Bacteroidota bacterium]
KLKSLLLKNTCFGTGKGFERPDPDPLFDHDDWRAFKLLRELKGKAIAQIGSSGTGNHFVEWGLIEIPRYDPILDMQAGQYLSLLSHSGSRGFGAGVAGFYSKLAMEKVKLPEAAKHLAWLDMNSEEGQEYWLAMNLAGAYASANHHHIHRKMAQDLELKPLKMIENHHNFAWKDKLDDGREVIIHRKGATPAHKNELGIIPGSMTAPGFLIKGKGHAKALFSASHGAGRVLSRSKARKTIQESEIKRVLKENKVLLIGGDLDEAPMAYKDIHQVMAFQEDLVEILAKFYPRIVRMADKEKFQRSRKKKGIDFQES